MRLVPIVAIAAIALLAGAATATAVTLDRQPPQTSITSGPPDQIVVRKGATATATWEFTADEPATFTCKFTGIRHTPCSSPQTYGGLAPGRYTFTVYAIDLARNPDASRARQQIRVVRRR